MPSPFPGMDPFIESTNRWGSFHIGMVVAISGQLNTRLPEQYIATPAEYIVLQRAIEGEASRRKREPDVHIKQRAERAGVGEVVALAEAPTRIVLPAVQPRRRRYIEVVDRENRRVVTALELLSPANKSAGEDRTAYLRKRNEYRAGGISLVEIDLLRGGRRLPLSNPPPEIGDFYIMVCPSWEHPRADFWTFTVRDVIPTIPVPLTDEVPPVPLDLRACLDRVYDESRWSTDISYDQPLKPRLDRRNTAWVHDLLTAQRTTPALSPEKE